MQAQKASDSPRREREGREADLGHRLNKALAGMRPSRRNVNTKYASKERYKAGMVRALGAKVRAVGPKYVLLGQSTCCWAKAAKFAVCLRETSSPCPLGK